MADPSPNHSLDHESRVTEVIVILSVACTLSTLVVAMRCYSRLVILRSFGLDDALIIPAQVRRTGSPEAGTSADQDNNRYSPSPRPWPLVSV